MSTWGNNEPPVRSDAQKYLDEVARFLGTIRATRITLVVLIAVSTVVIGVSGGGATLGLGLVWGFVGALMVHVVLGFLEHALRLLAGIYANGTDPASA